MNSGGWNPSRELEDMSERLNRIFARGSRGQHTENEAMTVAEWTPAVDITETGGEFLITVEIPGVKKEDVKVTLEQGVLTIQGMRRKDEGAQGTKSHRVERSYGSFARKFSLPDLVDDGNVQAVFKEGILTLHLPKSQKAKPKAIEVKLA